MPLQSEGTQAADARLMLFSCELKAKMTTGRTESRSSCSPTPRSTPESTEGCEPRLDLTRPPATGNARLDGLLHDIADTTLEKSARQRAQHHATWLSVKERSTEALDWISRYDIATDRLQQGVAVLNLSALNLQEGGETHHLNMEDREFLSGWLCCTTNPMPVSLDLSAHHFTDKMAQWLAGLLDESDSTRSKAPHPLRSLTISYCTLAVEQMAVISQGFKKSSLEKLRYECDTDSASQDKRLIELAKGLKSHPTLRILRLGGHSSKRGLGAICGAMKHGNCLEELDLSRCSGTTSDAQALSELLKSTRTLKTLNIKFMEFKPSTTFNKKAGQRWTAPTGTRQQIKRKAVAAVNRLRKKQPPVNSAFEALAGNCSLTILIADGAPFDDQLTLALAAFIGQENCRLKELHHSGFEAKGEMRSLEVLKTATGKNRSLVKSHCNYPGDPCRYQAVLAELAARNRGPLLKHAPLAMQALANRSLGLEGAFPSDVAAGILDHLDPDSRLNLIRAMRI